MTALEVTLNGITFLVDGSDWSRLRHKPWRGVVNNKGRGSVTRQEGRTGSIRNIYIQHEIVGDVPEGMVVDHINGNPLDNRRSNLRVCTFSENSCNRGPQANNRLGLKGVTKKLNRFVARIRHSGRIHHLGSFLTAQEAAAAYDAAALSAFGPFAWLNANSHGVASTHGREQDHA